jgi:hypothetical protein
MHVSRSYTLCFKAERAIVFPLFTPLEEKKWVQGWDATIIFSKMGDAKETGCIFTTPHAGMPDTFWVLTRYDEANGIIQYARFAAGHHIGMIDLRVDDNTRVKVTYTLTGLSAAGDQYIQEEFSEQMYQHQHRMQSWQQGIDRYLRTLQTAS